MEPPARILIADDDRVVRRILRSQLTRLGYEVEEAADGEQALSRLWNGAPPDLVIVDYVMPGLTGLEVVQALRADDDPARSRLPIIMLSSRSDPRDIVAGLKAGLDDYLLKPFDADELAARVRAALGRTHRRREA